MLYPLLSLEVKKCLNCLYLCRAGMHPLKAPHLSLYLYIYLLLSTSWLTSHKNNHKKMDALLSNNNCNRSLPCAYSYDLIIHQPTQIVCRLISYIYIYRFLPPIVYVGRVGVAFSLFQERHLVSSWQWPGKKPQTNTLYSKMFDFKIWDNLRLQRGKVLDWLYIFLKL